MSGREGGAVTDSNGGSIPIDPLEIRQFREKGFRLLGSLELDEKVWWERFYACLEAALLEEEVLFPAEQAEIRMYRERPEEFRSLYYILQKVSG